MVVGLPYPNVKSLELQEKLAYLNANAQRIGTSASKPGIGGIQDGHEYYDTLCMRAVNQSIGSTLCSFLILSSIYASFFLLKNV